VQFYTIIYLLKQLLTMHIPIVRFRLCISMEDYIYKHVEVMHVLSVLMSFDMGSFPIWHILDNHNHGMNSKVLKYRGPKPYKSPYSNVDLVWKKGECHGHTNKISIECVYMPHAHVHGFLGGERSDLHTPVKWNIFKNVPHFPSSSCTYDPKLWNYPLHTHPSK